MKVYFDENFSPHMARGFAAFQQGRPEEKVEVLHVVDAFGRGAPDEEWITGVAKYGGVAITQDSSIQRTRHLASLCDAQNIGLFFFRPPKKTPYGYWPLIEWVLRTWPDIKKCSLSTPLPFKYEITPRGGGPRKL